VKESGAADDVPLPLEPVAVVGEGVFQFVDGGEVLVDEHLVGVVPQVLGGLQLGRVGWQEDEMEAVW
jgi:hypothetical protein